MQYATCALILACLVFNQGAAEDLDGNTTKTNLAGDENIDIKTYTLTLDNTDNSVYSGILSGSGQVIVTKGNWNSTTILTLSPGNAYSDFTGSVILQEGYTLEQEYAEGKVELASANIFYSSSGITNNGTIIASANQVLPNLSGNGKIQILSNNYTLTLNSTSNSNTEYSGNITGSFITETGVINNWSGEIIKTGSGKLTLSRDSGYFYFDGSVTVQAGTLELAGAEMFRSMPNTSVVTNNGTIVVGGGRQFLPNLNGSGNIETIEYEIPETPETPAILVKTSVTSYYNEGKDAEISGIISGPGNFVKQGPATLTLSGANTISGEIYISEGKICFTGDAIVATAEIDGASNGHIEYLVTDGTKVLYIPDDSKHIEVNTIKKTGGDALQIYEGSKGSVRAESFVISSGRVDYGGYFQSIVNNLGSFNVETGTTLSPGLSVDKHGEPVNTIGEMVITNGVTMTIESAAIALFEFDAYNENPSLQKFDRIVTQDVASVFAPASNSIVDLAFLDYDAWKWAKKDAEYHIVFDYNFPNGDYTYLLREKYRSYFSLLGKNNNGLYLVGKGAPVLLVPESSSWALMIGTLLTFLLFLKKKRG